MIEANVLADSISPQDHRLITVQVVMPRYLLSEYNTHRLFSRNSASSRAIPPEKQLRDLLEYPFIPQEFYGRAKGMGQEAPLIGEPLMEAQREWLEGRNQAVRQALALMTSGAVVEEAILTHNSEYHGMQYVIDLIAKAMANGEVPDSWLNVSKSTVNRLLETFKWHTVIVSSTEWENFFALRCPPGYEVDTDFPAEPEIQRVALAMREAMRASTPVELGSGEWHCPMVEGNFVGGVAAGPDNDYFWPKVSAGRCARVSFDTHELGEDAGKSLARAEALESNGHMSPFEHVATPFRHEEWEVREAMKQVARHHADPTGRVSGDVDMRTAEQLVDMCEFNGNFRGWTQYRKFIPYEANRRGHIEDREPWNHAGLPEHQPAMGGEV